MFHSFIHNNQSFQKLIYLLIISLFRWQDVARKLDTFIYPDEPDVPGLTFLTPIEWAPWMETIWYVKSII